MEKQVMLKLGENKSCDHAKTSYVEQKTTLDMARSQKKKKVVITGKQICQDHKEKKVEIA